MSTPLYCTASVSLPLKSKTSEEFVNRIRMSQSTAEKGIYAEKHGNLKGLGLSKGFVAIYVLCFLQ